MASIPARPSRVYLASPMTTYATLRYERMMAHARRHFPDAEILPARDLYTSNADWRCRWPMILPTLSTFVFFADGAGWIGYGVWTEIRDAHQRCIPIVHLAHDGSLHPWEAVQFGVPDEQNWQRYVRVRVASGKVVQ